MGNGLDAAPPRPHPQVHTAKEIMKLLSAVVLAALVSPLVLAAPPSAWTYSVRQGPRVIPNVGYLAHTEPKLVRIYFE